MATRARHETGDETPPQLVIVRPETTSLQMQLSGTWRVSEAVPSVALVQHELDDNPPARVAFETKDVVAWDSALVAFATRASALARAAEIAVDRSGLPPGVQRLMALAEVTPKHAAPPKPRPSPLTRIGMAAIDRGEAVTGVVRWVGELSQAFVRLVTGRATFQRGDLFLQMQLTGARAIWIVSLVAALFGLILAFVGAVQLQRFGATVYVADLVGIGIVREMGAMMTAIVIAGRTGAAFAAELGSMRATQEVDALTTLGISPVELLVLPRLIAVTLMMPLLCVYADVVGLLGGSIVGIGIMHITPRIYLDETIAAVSTTDLFGGMLKATTYGFLIGAAACLEGLNAGRTAAGVGKAATSAVVDGIVLVIATCGLFAVIFYRLGI